MLNWKAGREGEVLLHALHLSRPTHELPALPAQYVCMEGKKVVPCVGGGDCNHKLLILSSYAFAHEVSASQTQA